MRLFTVLSAAFCLTAALNPDLSCEPPRLLPGLVVSAALTVAAGGSFPISPGQPKDRPWGA